MSNKFALLILCAISLCTTACNSSSQEQEAVHYATWQEILERDTLRVGTMTSPTDFYIYRGQQFGWEYTKIRDFARTEELVLDISIAHSQDTLQAWIKEGKIDLSITAIPMTQKHQERFLFCGIEYIDGLVVVQHKETTTEVRELSDLLDKEVFALRHSVEALRLEQIREEMGGEASMVQLVDTLGVEEVLLKIAERDSTIQFALANARLASLYARYLPQLDNSVKASVPMRYNWFVHGENSSLQEAVNSFFQQSEKVEHYKQLSQYDRHIAFYFKEISSTVGQSSLYLESGAISPYDELFREEAQRLGWPWTILAAIAFQESRFQADVIGWSGARGLMGIMPATGRIFGATSEQLLQPKTSVRVAVDCLLAFREPFAQLPHHEDVLCFTLASYNAGSGHILDAQRLAEKYGAPSDIWYGGVRAYVLLKSNPTYYNDPVVRFGYMRGRETAKYVDDILERHMAYQAQTK